jgi:hypothetical protein
VPAKPEHMPHAAPFEVAHKLGGIEFLGHHITSVL